MLALTASACAEHDIVEDNTAAGSATFFISANSRYGISVTSRADDGESSWEDDIIGDGLPEDPDVNHTEEEDPTTPDPPIEAPKGLQHLHYAIADADGHIIDHHQSSISADFSRLTIEGLKYGKYSIMFLAPANGNEDLELETPAKTSDPWIVNPDEHAPFDNVYYYKKVDFAIGFDQAPVNHSVELDLAVSKVIVDFKVDNPTLWRYIKSVNLTLNDDVPTSLNADGTYSGAHQVSGYDMFINEGLYSFLAFPADQPISGYIDVVSSVDGGDDFTTRYTFAGLKLKQGVVSRVEIAYRHPDSDAGRIYVAEDQLWRCDIDTMFMADEPREVFYNNSLRNFYVDQPLQFAINSSGDLNVHLYSPIAVKNVRVLGRISNLSSEWFDLAYFEHIPPFMEGTFSMPLTHKSCLFKTISGRNIRIPAKPNLKPTDIELKFETDDPFMAKIATIKSHWYIRFSKYSADNENPGYWRHMTPILCRHGVALALNMAFMFDSQEFNDLLDTYDGILKDNSGNAIDLDALRSKLHAHGGLQLGCVAGVGGLGGGQTYGLADYCYTGVYHDATAPGSNPHNYARQAMFHEYGHCLGYNHSSNMTYGDKWTVLCATAFVQLGSEGKLPVPNRTDVTSLPINR